MCHEALGYQRCKALLSFHVLTGCDQTGRFSGKSKSTWWSAFLSAAPETLHTFSRLGIGEDLPSTETLEQLEKFVVALYGGPKIKRSISTLADLRWYLFSRYQHEADKLPPTFAALKYQIYRAHFVTMVLRRSHLPLQKLPPVTNFGWEVVDELLTPVMTDQLPTPITLLEMSACSCQTKCLTRRCKCYKNGFVCTDMCKCNNCLNSDDANDNSKNFVVDSSDEDMC